MPADFRFVANTAEELHPPPNSRPVARAIDLPSEVLPTPGGAFHQAEDRPLHFSGALLHGQIFEDAFLHLVQTEMIVTCRISSASLMSFLTLDFLPQGRDSSQSR